MKLGFLRDVRLMVVQYNKECILDVYTLVAGVLNEYWSILYVDGGMKCVLVKGVSLKVVN